MNEDRNQNQNDEYIPYYLSNKAPEQSPREERNPADSQGQPEYQTPQAERQYPKPVYYADSGKEERTEKPRKKKGYKKLIAMLVVVALLAGTAGTLSLFYQIVPGDGSTVFSLTRRGQENNAADNGNQLQVNPGNNASKNDQQSGIKAGGSSDGPQMQINGVPASSSPSSLATSNGGALTVAEIAAKVTPSVVGVVSNVESQYGTATYSGTGIVMSSDGYIITNNHVINGAKTITITLMNKKTYDGKLIGADERSDLAVVKIDATGLTPAEFGDSDALHVGDLAVAIGNPLGLELMGTVTDGIISAINRDVVVEERTMTLIQTNAAINAGNSGGPLINQYGQVIGINTLKMQDYYTSVEGLGFAIPTNTAKEIIDELIANGYIKGRPAIGITGNTITEAQARYYKVPQGMVVYSVDQRSDAAAKGLQVNDIITKAQGQEVKSSDEINKIKEQYKAGDDFKVTVYRDGKYIDITFKLMDEAELDLGNSNGGVQSPFVP